MVVWIKIHRRNAERIKVYTQAAWWSYKPTFCVRKDSTLSKTLSDKVRLFWTSWYKIDFVCKIQESLRWGSKLLLKTLYIQLLLSGWTDDIFHAIHKSFYEASLGRPGAVSQRISMYLNIEVMWNSNVLCAVLFWLVSCMYSDRLDVWLTVCLWIYSHGNWVVIRSTVTMFPPYSDQLPHSPRHTTRSRAGIQIGEFSRGKCYTVLRNCISLVHRLCITGVASALFGKLEGWMDGIRRLVLPINFLRQVHTIVSIIDLYVDDLSFIPASEAQQIFGMNSRMEFSLIASYL